MLILTNHRIEDGSIVLSYSPKQVSIGHVTVQRVKLLVRREYTQEVMSHPPPPPCRNPF